MGRVFFRPKRSKKFVRHSDDGNPFNTPCSRTNPQNFLSLEFWGSPHREYPDRFWQQGSHCRRPWRKNKFDFPDSLIGEMWGSNLLAKNAFDGALAANPEVKIWRRPIFTARCYASVVLDMGLCLSVCVHLSVTSRSSTKTAKWRITQTTPHDTSGI